MIRWTYTLHLDPSSKLNSRDLQRSHLLRSINGSSNHLRSVESFSDPVDALAYIRSGAWR